MEQYSQDWTNELFNNQSPEALSLVSFCSSSSGTASTAVETERSDEILPKVDNFDGLSPTDTLLNLPKSAVDLTDQKLPVVNEKFPHTITKRHLLKVWYFQIVTMAFSIIGVAVVSIILGSLDTKPLSHWKLPISPNALVSTFTTISKSAMLYVLAQGISQLKWIYFRQRTHRLADLDIFDSASRDPLGSGQLCWSIRWRAIVASTGALLTVLAIVIDPLSQQILHYSSALVAAPAEVAAMPVAQVFDPRADPLSSMREKVYQELVETGGQQAFTCSTGNCTWHSFETLGLHSTCEDISPNITTDCRYDPAPLNDGIDEKNPDQANMTCKYQIPSLNFSYTTVWTVKANASSKTVESGPILMGRRTLDSPFPVLPKLFILRFPRNYYPPAAAIWQVNLTSTNIHWIPNAMNCSASLPHALHCFLDWQILTLSARSENGKLRESVIDSEALLPFNFGVVPDSTTAVVPTNSSYYIAPAGVLAIRNLIADVFLINRFNNSANKGGILLPPVEHILLYGDESVAGLNQSVSNILRGVTNYIRSGPNTTDVHGSTLISATIVNVQWAWFTLPLALVVLTAGFFATSVFFSTESGAYVWKASSVPFYFIERQSLETGVESPKMLKEMEQQSNGQQFNFGRMSMGDLCLWERERLRSKLLSLYDST